MASRRIQRTALHKHSNHARVTAYSAHLGEIFRDWLAPIDARGYSVGSLVTRLDTAAVDWFPQAFANGRHQAYPKPRPSIAGQEVLQAKILSNRHYLHNSLGPDIERRVAKWQIRDEDIPLSEALRQSFKARIEDQYGGAIWTVTEAGYRAGVAQARADLAIRMTGAIRAQEDDEEDQPQEGDHELAVALGLTIAGLLLLIATGRSRGDITSQPSNADQFQVVEAPGILDRAGVAVLLAYNDEGDDKVCEPCAGNADGSPYSEDECPLPGEDCEGMASCRCFLSTVVDESALVPV